MFSRASLERGPRYRVMVVRNLVDPPVVLSRGRFRLYVLHVRSSQTWTCGSYAFGLKDQPRWPIHLILRQFRRIRWDAIVDYIF